MRQHLVLTFLGVVWSLACCAGLGGGAYALRQRARGAVWERDGPAGVQAEEAAGGGEDQLENPDLKQDAEATLPGEDAGSGEDQGASGETGGEGDTLDEDKLRTDFFAAAAIDADEFTAADFALAEDARAAALALQDLAEAPMTASRDPSRAQDDGANQLGPIPDQTKAAN